jgi:hypothetical protein
MGGWHERAAAAFPFIGDNPDQFVGDYTIPILKPKAAEVVKKHGEIELRPIML